MDPKQGFVEIAVVVIVLVLVLVAVLVSRQVGGDRKSRNTGKSMQV